MQMLPRVFSISLATWVLWLGSVGAAASLQAAEPVVERLGVPGPLTFAGQQFVLSWSSHASAELYKQEYVPAGQDLEHYQDMLMIDLRTEGAGAAELALGVDAQVQARRKTDPVANSEVVISPDGAEATVDMLMSANDESGQFFVEWSAHRFQTNSNGKGTRMLGITRRAYGDPAAKAMLIGLKKQRIEDIAKLRKAPMPAVSPSN